MVFVTVLFACCCSLYSSPVAQHSRAHVHLYIHGQREFSRWLSRKPYTPCVWYDIALYPRHTKKHHTFTQLSLIQSVHTNFGSIDTESVCLFNRSSPFAIYIYDNHSNYCFILNISTVDKRVLYFFFLSSLFLFCLLPFPTSVMEKKFHTTSIFIWKTIKNAYSH